MVYEKGRYLPSNVALEFSLQRAQASLDQLRAEVSDHPNHLGQILENIEGRAAFEIHKKEIEQARVIFIRGG